MNRMDKIAELESQLRDELINALVEGELICEDEADIASRHITFHGDRDKVKSYIVHYYWDGCDMNDETVFIMMPDTFSNGTPEYITLQREKGASKMKRKGYLQGELDRINEELTRLNDGK